MSSLDIEMQKLLDAIQHLAGAEIDLRLAPEDWKSSRQLGVKTARIELERCLRKVLGGTTQSQLMRAVAVTEDPDPFGEKR